MATAAGILGTSLRWHRKFTQHVQDKDHPAGIVGYRLLAAVGLKRAAAEECSEETTVKEPLAKRAA